MLRVLSYISCVVLSANFAKERPSLSVFEKKYIHLYQFK